MTIQVNLTIHLANPQILFFAFCHSNLYLAVFFLHGNVVGGESLIFHGIDNLARVGNLRNLVHTLEIGAPHPIQI